MGEEAPKQNTPNYQNIVDFEITWALVPLCELVRLYVTDAQANSLCYKCKHIFRFYYISSCNERFDPQIRWKIGSMEVGKIKNTAFLPVILFLPVRET